MSHGLKFGTQTKSAEQIRKPNPTPSRWGAMLCHHASTPRYVSLEYQVRTANHANQKTPHPSPPPPLFAGWLNLEAIGHACRGTDTRGTDADLHECQDKLGQRHVKNDDIIWTLSITHGGVAHIRVRVLQGQFAFCSPFAGSQKLRVTVCNAGYKAVMCTVNSSELAHLHCSAEP